MAGLATNPDVMGQGSGDANFSSKKDVFDPMALQVNMQRIDRIRSVMGIASGCMAGTLGFTGLQGLGMFFFASTGNRSVDRRISYTHYCILSPPPLSHAVCFLFAHVFVMVTIWAWKMNFDLNGHTKQSWMGYLTTGIQNTALSFTLFWTLFYGLVYLY